MIVHAYDEQKSAEILQRIDNSVEEDDSDYEISEYDSDEDSDYEEESDTEYEEEEDNEDEERHQLYRQEAFEFNLELEEQENNNDSDTDVLSDNENMLLSPPVLRRERPEDYFTPERTTTEINSEPPRINQIRYPLRDISNIVPRRLFFN